MQINENRELYDLCRKYKFFYKQHEEIKHLDKCYWSKYIREAYKESEQNLNDVTKEIIKLILNDFIDDGGVNISQDVLTDVNSPFANRLSRLSISMFRPMAEVTITSDRLATIVKDMMMEKGYGY